MPDYIYLKDMQMKLGEIIYNKLDEICNDSKNKIILISTPKIERWDRSSKNLTDEHYYRISFELVDMRLECGTRYEFSIQNFIEYDLSVYGSIYELVELWLEEFKYYIGDLEVEIAKREGIYEEVYGEEKEPSIDDIASKIGFTIDDDGHWIENEYDEFDYDSVYKLDKKSKETIIYKDEEVIEKIEVIKLTSRKDTGNYFKKYVFKKEDMDSFYIRQNIEKDFDLPWEED